MAGISANTRAMAVKKAFDAVRDRGLRWISIARLLPLAGWPAVVWSVLANLVIGLLPVVFIVGTSVMLERVSVLGAVPHRVGVWPGALSAFALAVGALVVQNA